MEENRLKREKGIEKKDLQGEGGGAHANLRPCEGPWVYFLSERKNTLK